MRRKPTIIFIILLVITGLVFVTNSALLALENASKLPPCCQDGQKKKSSINKELENYQKLILTKAHIKNGKLSVEGETDLPNGSKLIISLIENNAGLEGIVIKEKTIEVNNLRFSAVFSFSDELQSQDIQADVLFDPKIQNSGVSSKIPRSGENLTGDQVQIQNGRKTLRISQFIDPNPSS
jgi:hypothetical protein